MYPSEAQLRIMIDTIPALAWCCLPDGANEFTNKRWLDYTGLSRAETLGQGWQRAFHPDDLAKRDGEVASHSSFPENRAGRKPACGGLTESIAGS